VWHWEQLGLRSHHIRVVVAEERPMYEYRRLGSWALLPHDDSKVVAPYDDSKVVAPYDDSKVVAPYHATAAAVCAGGLPMSRRMTTDVSSPTFIFCWSSVLSRYWF
jgi:hypothetical protein